MVSQQTKTSIVSLLTSLVMLVFAIPSLAAVLTPELQKWVVANLPHWVDLASALATLVTILYKLWPKSKTAKVALAAELPQVSRMVVAPTIAKTLKAANSNLRGTVLTHDEAVQTTPPIPQAA